MNSVRMMLFLVLGFSVLTTASLSKAAPLNELMNQLRDSAVDYEIVGTVCEQVARLEMQKIYPPSQYSIINGISYGDNRRTIGELDVTVFENASKNVVLVGEVKCWRNSGSALTKAREQRQRLVRSLAQGNIQFQTQDYTFNQSQFQHNPKMVAIGPQGTAQVGFEVELENTLQELMQLRKMMMECQHNGQCAAAERGH